MDTSDFGEIITFYSYKGGTGRTMALANIAYLITQKNTIQKGVLMIDWDLEAPGLHRYFENYAQFKNEDLGLIDFFLETKQYIENQKIIECEDIFPEIMDDIEFEEKYIINTNIKNLSLLKAGKLDENFSTNVNKFNWEEFFINTPDFFQEFSNYLARKFDYILIDSRTGSTDIGGICTMLMPEKLVAVFTPNKQSLLGVINLIENAISYRNQADDLRELIVYPLASRIDDNEEALRQEWRNTYEFEFQDCFNKIYNSKFNLTNYFDEIKIPYKGYYAFGEELAVIQERDEALSLHRAYKDFYSKLVYSEFPFDSIFADEFTNENTNTYPKVYISSTGSDLIEYRQAAQDICERLGFSPVMFEYFEAMSSGATEGSLKKLGECDLYIGIIAHRYGYIEDGYDLSVTELEFDQARKMGLDCLCFVIDPEHPWPPKFIESNNYHKLENFKKKVDQLINVRFTTVENFKVHLTNALTNWREKNLEFTDQITSSPRFNIPTPVADFTGREEELNWLLSEININKVPIIGIRGLGGIGKTQLALALAEKLKTEYPDAHLLIDLKGAAEQAPLSSEEALIKVISTFHPNAKLPTELDQLRSIYLDTLHDKRIILILDNASNTAQVTPLLPPDGSIVLVTSRQLFTLPGWNLLNLNPLSIEQATKLIIQIAPDAAEYAKKIAHACSCLPLAIRLTASTLAETPDLHPEDYLEELLQESSIRAELVRASLNLSLRQLDEEVQIKWRILGIFPVDFDHAAATAIWAIEETASREILSTLSRYSLLAYDKSTRRYRLHSLTQDYARTRLEEDKSTAHIVGLQHSQYYLKILTQANSELLSGSEGWRTGTALFDLERPNIEAGQAWAAKHLNEKTNINNICIDYALQTEILNLRLPPQTFITWLEVGLSAAREVKNKTAIGTALGNLGLAYANLGQVDKAIDFYRKQLDITRETGDRRIESNALGNLGLAYVNLGQIDKAIDYYRQVLDITSVIGDKRGEGKALGNLGLAYAKLGQVEKAIDYYTQVLDITRETGDRRSEGNTLGNLGLAYANLGQIEKAIDYYQSRLEIARETGDRQGEANSSWNFGLLYKNQGKLEKAIPLMQVYVDFAREIGHAEAKEDAAYLEELKQELNNQE